MERLTERKGNNDRSGISTKSLVIEDGMRKGFPSGHCERIVNNQVDLEYYDLKGGTHHIYMAPGNVQWICNILFNTEKMFNDFINDPPEWAKNKAGWDWDMQIKRNRIHKIRMQVEEGLGYSTEEHWEKCLKMRSKKQKDDIGGNALELAFKRASEKKKEVPKATTEKLGNAGAEMIDGVTLCCGYDFGLDQDKASYCPICGKKLIK